jgi:hypothetical protein
MWPFASYPERSPEDVEGKSYDYIIVGGKIEPTLQDGHTLMQVRERTRWNRWLRSCCAPVRGSPRVRPSHRARTCEG